MARVLIGAFCGNLLGGSVALVAYSIAIALMRAAQPMPPEAAANQPVVEFVYYPQLVFVVLTSSGLGGVIGAIAGGVSVIVRAIRGRDGMPPD